MWSWMKRGKWMSLKIKPFFLLIWLDLLNSVTTSRTREKWSSCFKSFSQNSMNFVMKKKFIKFIRSVTATSSWGSETMTISIRYQKGRRNRWLKSPKELFRVDLIWSTSLKKWETNLMIPTLKILTWESEYILERLLLESLDPKSLDMIYLERVSWLPIKWSPMVFLVKFAQVNKPRICCNKIHSTATSTISNSTSHSVFHQLTRISSRTLWL